jgi:hypothetical protein
MSRLSGCGLTPLLKKLHKGTSAIQNLEIMKNCEALGIENISNRILCFSGSDKQDVALTLQNIEFALPYRPLKTAAFWLIYLFCSHHRSLKKIRDRFPAFSEDKIVAFLKMMVAKKLMFEENDRYLSLAVPVDPWR